MPKSRRFAPTPVMPRYYDDMLAQIMWGQQNEELPGNRRDAKMAASGMEDERLRGLLGSKRRKRKNERTPDGAYALAQYPQLGIAMMQASQGQMAPGGNSANIGLWMKDRELGADPYAPMRRAEERKRWAAEQMRLLGGW